MKAFYADRGLTMAHAWREFEELPGEQTTLPLFLSSYEPAPYGMAGYTRELADALDRAAGGPASSVVAVRRHPGRGYRDRRVAHTVEGPSRHALREAARFCNQHACDVVSIQHEDGLYPGPGGEAVLDFARACSKPLVTTFHSLSLDPGPADRRVVRELAERSEHVVVAARTARHILESIYGIGVHNVRCIPRGVHPPMVDGAAAVRFRRSIRRRPMLLTFGLLEPGKGVEYVIEALPEIVELCPSVMYHVVGPTHPVEKAAHGESYRQRLMDTARRLGVAGHVTFDTRFLSQADLFLYLRAADVFVAPYDDAKRIVSGTLACALSAGRATVATPFLYAQELAGRGGALLADFRDGAALARQVLRLLADPYLRVCLEARASELSRPMLWPRVAWQYLDLFRDAAAADCPARSVASQGGEGLAASPT